MLRGAAWCLSALQQLQMFRDGLVDVRLQGTIMDMLTDVNTGIGWVMEKIGHYGGGCCHPLTCPVSSIQACSSALLHPVQAAESLSRAGAAYLASATAVDEHCSPSRAALVAETLVTMSQTLPKQMHHQSCHASAPMLPSSLKPRSPGLVHPLQVTQMTSTWWGSPVGPSWPRSPPWCRWALTGDSRQSPCVCLHLRPSTCTWGPASAPGMRVSHRRAVSAVLRNVPALVPAGQGWAQQP